MRFVSQCSIVILADLSSHAALDSTDLDVIAFCQVIKGSRAPGGVVGVAHPIPEPQALIPGPYTPFLFAFAAVLNHCCCFESLHEKNTPIVHNAHLFLSSSTLMLNLLP